MARNLFPGTCYRCGEPVGVKEGHFERAKIIGGKQTWRVQHAECAIKYRGTDVGKPAPKGARAP